MNNSLFTEKYRPQELNDLVGDFKEINKYIESPNLLPHLLFVGSPGTGKTTLAMIIVKKLGADCLKINASDETGVDTIRAKVKTFAYSMSSKPGIPRIVFLDEADYLTKNSQAILRSLMEEYIKNCRFILTANYERKIIEPLVSRCVKYDFGSFKKHDIIFKLEEICKKENKEYTEEGLKKLVDVNYPDIRIMVKNLQQLEKINVEFIKSKNEKINIVYGHILDKKIYQARKFWLDNNLDIRELILGIFRKVFESNYDVEVKRKVVDLCGIYDNRMCLSGDNDIQMTDFSIKLMEVLK